MSTGRREYVAKTIDGRSTTQHILIVEGILGRRPPPGTVVHHWDGNKKNNRNCNLLVCPNQSYHQLIHSRMDAYEACGNPGYRKCSRCSIWGSPNDLIVRSHGLFHPICYKDFCRRQYNRRGI